MFFFNGALTLLWLMYFHDISKFRHLYTKKTRNCSVISNVNLFVVTKMKVYVGDKVHGTERRVRDKLFIR